MWTTESRGRYDRSKLRYPSDLTDDEWALGALASVTLSMVLGTVDLRYRLRSIGRCRCWHDRYIGLSNDRSRQRAFSRRL